jgi:tRNA A37 threonylcarbamoyltransferase TsaD
MSLKLALAIESSCDETSLAIFLLPENVPENFLDKVNSFIVLGSIVSSQIKIHQEYGGVIPEIGARSHANQIHYLWNLVWQQAKQKASELGLGEIEIINLEKILVTTNPGLVSALRVGMEFAKSMKFFLELKGGLIEIISVNHLRGHVASCFYKLDVKTWLLSSSDKHLVTGAMAPTTPTSIAGPTTPKPLVSPATRGTTTQTTPQTTPKPLVSPLTRGTGELAILDSDLFPHLHLLVSGGNTQLLFLKSWNDYEIVGQTLDDAIGESLDKIGRMVGLPYPAGISVARIAGLSVENPLNLSVGMKNDQLNFSYSGMKTAVRYLVQSKSDLIKFEELLPEEDVKFLISLATTATPKPATPIASQSPATPKPSVSPLTRGTFTSDNQLVSGSKLHFIQQLCISAQYVAISQISQKVQLAINLYNPKSLGVSGGVSANLLLREELKNVAKKHNIENLFIPQLALTGDNAVMIGLAGLMSV